MVISRRYLKATFASWIVLGGVHTVVFGSSGLVPWIVFLLVAPALIFGAILIPGIFTKRRDRIETRLASILALDPAKAVKIAPLEPDWKVIRGRCMDKMSNAKSYSTRSIFQSFTNEKLAGRNHIFMQWRADFSSPDRWHVTQEGVDNKLGVLWDEWISIGKQNFQNAGIWYQTDDDLHADWNWKLSLNGLLKVVAEQTPNSIEFIQHRRCRYVVVRYSRAAVLSSIGYSWFDDGDGGVSNAELKDAMGDLEIWVDAAAKDIIKGTIPIHEGTREVSRFSQAFTCFNENIKVVAPLWLNAVPSQSGGLTVVDTRLLRVPHHR